ncbi:MAG TPA: hypothetical protein PK156_50925, partial [Polyangium sp.]|nr:hypothetical protein [Polyangium sp.]
GNDTLADTDGDGLLEIVATDQSDKLTVGDFDGDGRDDVLEDDEVLIGEPSLQDIGVFRGDFDGDGRDDLLKVWIDLAKRTHFKAVTQGGEDADRLIEVGDEGSEWRERITYTRTYAPDVDPQSCTHAYPLACVRRGASVVARIESRTGTPRDRQYSYGEPIFDRQGRGFLGYRFIREWEPDRPRQTTTYFDHATFQTNAAGTKRVAVGAFRPKLVIQVTPLIEHPVGGVAAPVNGFVGARVFAKQILYDVDWSHEGKTYFVHPREWSTSEWDTTVHINQSTWPHISEPEINWHSPRRVDGTLKFDWMGNLRASTRHTLGGTFESVEMTYDIRENDWLVSLPEYRIVTSTDVSGASETRTTHFVHDARGLLDRVEVEPEDPDVYQRIHYVRNAQGLVIEEQRTITPQSEVCPQADGCPRTNHVSYDDEGVHVAKAWNALNHTDWVIVHPSLGVPMAATDENGVLTQWIHDDLGRLVNHSRDGGAAMATTYAPWMGPGLSIQGVSIASSSSDGRESLVFVDDRGRTLEQRAQGFDGTWSQVTNSLDALNRVWRVYRPAAVGANLETTPSTTMLFDSLDRVRVTKLPNGSSVTADHSMFTTTTLD